MNKIKKKKINTGFLVGFAIALISINSNAWFWGENKTNSSSSGVQTEQTLLGNSGISNEPLPLDEAFAFSAEAKNGNTIVVLWNIHPEYQLYRNKFFVDVKGAEFGHIIWPKGKETDDILYGKVETHRGNLSVDLPLTNITSNKVDFTVKYQGCWDGGVCYPPAEKKMEIILK